MEKVFVIARYQEDIEWANKYPNRVIIQKDKDIPNLGRESSSYAWYIIQNYDNLPDNITFCQGKPFEHIDSIEAPFTDSIIVHGRIFKSDHKGQPDHPGLQVSELAKELDIEIPEILDFIVGAQFTVHKNLILKHPKKFYVKLYDLANNFTDAPWILERLWLYIFK